MRQVIFIIFMVVLACDASGQGTSRWRNLNPDVGVSWDAESARKIDATTVRFWYDFLYLQDLKDAGVRDGSFTPEVANTIRYGRVGVIARCKSMEQAVFSGAELNADKVPVTKMINIPISQIQFQHIHPDTIGEAVVIAVCKHFKIR
jgi:hypothetical protein